MKAVFWIILQVILVSGILYGYYHLFLRNNKFHQYNRFYLLAATIISLLVPFLNIPVYFTPEEKDSSLVWQTLSALSSSDSPGVSTVMGAPTAQPGPSFTAIDLLYYSYMAVVIVFFVRMIYSLLKIRHIIRNNTVEQLDDIYFVVTEEPTAPFSFFKWLFWHKKTELSSQKGEQIFRHELFHIRQKHSADIIFMEFVGAIGWINPFFLLIKRETIAIHEFLADQFAVI